MLVFGPYRAIPREEQFVVYNLSSLTEAVPRLPGLFVIPNLPENIGELEKSFDMWYYDYVLNDITACTSLMTILTSLYDGNKVYICIGENASGSNISALNESFMKLIQNRYDIKYSIINEPDDYYYIPHDGCDFASVDGIYNFDSDRKRFMQLSTENAILSGGL